MDTRWRMSVVMGMLLLMVAMKGERVSSAGSNDCISKIVTCANYVNTTTKPPSECCDPLLEVINNDQACLCNVLKSGIISNFGITLQQALQLPLRCGKAVTDSACFAGGPSSTPTVNTPPPPALSSTTINSAAAISISTLIAMTLLVYLQ